MENPFPGLQAYRVKTAPLFYGRKTLTHELLNQLFKNEFLTVVGASGTGKTSLINCEVIDTLVKGHHYRGTKEWKFTSFSPGRSPLSAFAQSLASLDFIKNTSEDKIDANLSAQFEKTLRNNKFGVIDIVEEFELTKDQNILIFIDQLEDVLSYSNENKSNDAEIFINQLIQVINQSAYPVVVIGSLNAEYLPRFTDYPAFADLINKNQYIIPGFVNKDCFEVIEGISLQNEMKFDVGFMMEINNYFRSHSFSLVKFQHALKRSVDLWLEKQHRSIVGLHYLEQVGGFSDSIPVQLEAIFDSFNDEQKYSCELIFRTFTAMNSTGEVSNFPLSIQEIAFQTGRSVKEVIEIAEKFTDSKCGVLQVKEVEGVEARLKSLTKKEEKLNQFTELQVAQKEILFDWERLSIWIKDERVKANVFLELVVDSDQGESLYEGEKLASVINWMEKENPHNNWASRYSPKYIQAFDFYDQSVKLFEDKRKRRQAEIATQEKKANKFRRNIVLFSVFTGLLVLLSIYFGDNAFEENKKAQKAKNEAHLAREEARKADSIAYARNIKANNAILLANQESEIAERAKFQSDSLNQINKKTQRKIGLMNANLERSRREIQANLNELRAAKRDITASQDTIEKKERESKYLDEIAYINDIVENGSKIISNNLYSKDQVVLGANVSVVAYNKFDSLSKNFSKDERDASLEKGVENNLLRVVGLAFQHMDNNPVADNFTKNGVLYGVKLAKHPKVNQLTIGTNEGKLFKTTIDENEPFNNVKIEQLNSEKRQLIDGIRDLNYSIDGSKVYYSTVEGHLKVVGESTDIIPEGITGQIPSMMLVHRFENGDMVSVGYNSKIYLAKSGQETSTEIKAFNEPIYAVSYNNNVNTLLIALKSGLVQKMIFNEVTHLFDEGNTYQIEGLHASISSISYLEKFEEFVIGTSEGEMILYSCEGEGEMVFHDDNEHASRINCIHFDSLNNVIITGGNDEVINVWDYLKIRSLSEKEHYDPVKFIEKLPVQDVHFVNKDWFMTVTRGTAINEGEGRVSMWSISLDELTEELKTLIGKNEIKADDFEVKKFTEK